MPSITRRLKRLRHREKVLRANLLGHSSSWGAPPSDEEYDRALAYRVLMHAEIERYLEDALAAALLSSLEILNNLGKVTHPAASALAHYRSKCFLDGQENADSSFADSNEIALYAQAKLADVVKWIEGAVVKNNNGIKPADIRKLMGWLGINLSQLDPNLLDALRQLATARGDAAHLSRREIWRRYSGRSAPAGASKIRRLPSPSDEVAAVDAVLKLLPQLDRMVQAKLRDVV
ncbi:HEPN domain-containing protein [Streptomyces globisporus]|uniref:HEPN domain-containing protein n=1 Tax=Streptomyces globisporus TaxID=1908 RepID=UPI0037B0D5D2